MLATLWPSDTSSRLHLVTLVAFAGVEAVVFTSLYTTLPSAVRQASDETVWVLLWFGLMVLALLRRAASAISTSPQQVRVVYLIAYIPLLLVCLLLLTNDFLGIALAALMALVLWWRGLSLGQSHLYPQSARMHFWWGLGLVTALLAFDFKLARMGLLIGLAVLGLLALIVSQLNAVAQHNDISPRALTRPAWRKALGLVLLVAFGLIGLDAVLLNSEAAAWLVRGVLALILFPIGLVVGFLLWVLQRMLPTSLFEGLGKALQLLMQRLNALEQAVPPAGDPVEAVQKSGQLIDPQMMLLGGILGLIAVVLLALLLGMGLRRAVKRRREVDAMPTEYISPDDDEGNAVEEDAPSRLGNTFSRWFAAATIRLIYARMAHQAAKRGYDRKPTQTTQEFLPALQQAFPTAEADVRLISDAYEAAHYGQVPDTAAQLTTIRDAWERVRRIQPATNNQQPIANNYAIRPRIHHPATQQHSARDCWQR